MTSILTMVREDLADQEDLIDEQEKLVALLRSAGLPTAQAQEQLQRLYTIHVRFLELEIALDPQAARSRGRLH